MRRIAKIILFLIILIIAGLVAAPMFIPADTIKAQVLAQIKAKTGYDIAMGKVSFKLFPNVSLDADDVTVANPAWAGKGKMAEIKTLNVGLELMPLLHKQVNLTELVLDRPTLLLIKQKDRANWDFGTPGERAVGQPQTKKEAADKSQAGLEQLHLAKIVIKGGNITYRDEATHTTQAFKDFDLTLKAPDLVRKADLQLSGMYGDKKISLDASLEKPFAFSSGSPTAVNIKAGYGPLSVTWKGDMALKAGNHPVINGTIAIPSLNTADFAAKTASGKPAESAQAPANAARWSDAPIPFELLNAADGDLTLSIGKLTLSKTSLSDVVAHIKLRSGSLAMNFDPLKAYGGDINVAVGASANGGFTLNLGVAHAQAEPLLHDFASYDRVSGTIDMKTALSSSGRNQRALVGALGGNGNVHFSDGKLKGINIPSLLRNVTGSQSEEQGTEFSELSGSFTIARGVVSTNDLKMNSPLLRMTGEGTADLPNWREHFLLKPTLVASLQGQGGKDMNGITIPIHVEGPLDHPSYKPDLGAVLQDALKDPAKLKENVQGIKDSLKNRDALKGSLKNLLR